jgi:DNA modification methylase
MEVNMEKLLWNTEKRRIGDLVPYEHNPRQMTEKQAEDLQKSLERFNLVEIPAIDTDNKIIAGHQRLKIMALLGRIEEEIDVRVPNRKLSEEEFIEYNLRSNKNTAEWDLDALLNFSEDLLRDGGFTQEELDGVFSLGIDVDDNFDVQKELEKVLKAGALRVKEGDVWQLGEHRLIVGDCTKKENWQKLLGDEKYDFMFTDPPYRISYCKYGKVKKDQGFGYKANRKYLGVEKRGSVPEFEEWFSIAHEYENPKGVNVMIFENWKNTVELWQAMEKYWKIRNMVIWHLPNRCQGFGAKHKFFNKHDIALLADKEAPENNEEYEQELDDYLREKGQKLLDTNEVMLYAQKGKSYWDRKKKTPWARISDHITWSADTASASGQNLVFGTKPIQILVPYIKILSPRDGVVIEPFAGSGSTIIASEIMKRKCRAIEYSEIYAEVILARYEKFTGKKAVKL